MHPSPDVPLAAPHPAPPDVGPTLLRDAVLRALLETPGPATPLLIASDARGSVLALPEQSGRLFLLVAPFDAPVDDTVELVRRIAAGADAPSNHLALVGGPDGVEARLGRELGAWRHGKRQLACHRIRPDGTLWSAGGKLKPLAHACEAVEAQLARGEETVPLAEGALVAAIEKTRRVALAERAFADQLGRRQPVVTIGIIGLNVLLFAAAWALGGTSSSTVLHRLGANGPEALAGEPWRLLASAFLHAGPLHLGLNMLALWMLGNFLERVLGPSRFTVTYVLSALGGAIASASLNHGAPAVGASGAIFGIMATTLVLALRKGVLPPATRARLRAQLPMTVAVNVAYSFLPRVDLWAHAGGALAGILLAWSGLVSRKGSRGAWTAASRAALAMVVASLGLTAWASRPWELLAPPPVQDVALGPVTVTLPKLAGRLVTADEDGRHEVAVGDLGADGLVVRAFAVTTGQAVPDAALDTLVPVVAAAVPAEARLESAPAIVPVDGRPMVYGAWVRRDGLRVQSWATLDGGWVVGVEAASAPDVPAAWQHAGHDAARSVRLGTAAP